MRLTKSDKQAIVRAIIAKLPRIDPKDFEQRLQEKLYQAMSPQCKGLMEQNQKRLGKVFNRTRIYIGWPVRQDIYVYPGDANDPDAILAPFFKELSDAEDLHSKLTAAFETINTRKQAVARFPEFVEFLPPEQGKTENLPATQDANLIAALVKAGAEFKVTRENS